MYPAKKELFATNMMEANKDVIDPLVDQSYKSLQDHIVIRVLPGGEKYYIIILDDGLESMKVKNIFGPYISKKAYL